MRSRWGGRKAIHICGSLYIVGITLCLRGARAAWIDPDTPQEAYKHKSLVDGTEYTLVMSDEFNKDGRTFDDGDDPMWTAEIHSDDAQSSAGYGSLHFYNSSQVTCNDGYMNITTSSETTKWKGFNPFKRKYETLFKNFKSGMVSSWNKFCYTGGIIELRAVLPGYADIGGLWPAFWLLGNLGRATYEASTNLVWPWSFNKCDRTMQLAQEISACNGVKHFGMHSHEGRGSTEIDIFEAMPGVPGFPATTEWDPIGLPYLSGSLQVAPGINDHRPEVGEKVGPRDKWYQGMTYGPNTTQNYHFYGLMVDKTLPMEPVYRSEKQKYRADGLSSISVVGETHFTDFHTYKLDWQPGPNGHLIWYIDDEMTFTINQESLDIVGSQIPVEPSYVIFNTAVANSWGFPIPCPPGCPCTCYDCNDPDCECSFFPGFCNSLPAHFQIDHVRIWQNPNDTYHTLGCDPEDHPTRLFIKAHPDRYTRDDDDDPLKKIKVGGHKCEDFSQCGNGTCSGYLWKTCHCNEGWVGPRCLVPDYHDENVFTSEVDMTPHLFRVPMLLRVLGTCIAALVIAATLVVGASKAKVSRTYKAEMRKVRIPAT